MRSIRIDEEVWAYLQAHAVPLTDTANTTLRRLLGFDEKTVPANGSPFAGQRGGRPRYLPGKALTISGPGTHDIVSGVRNDRGADLNQVQTDLARLVGSRNPATRAALDRIISGSRRESLGQYTLTVTDVPGR